MTFSKEVTVWCDSEDCQTWEKFSRGTFKQAQKEARNRGWTSPEWGEHYCPDCNGESHV